MRRLPLTRNNAFAGFVLVDDADYPWLAEFHWRLYEGASGGRYAVRTIPGAGRSMRMHRDIMGLEFGGPLEVDHRNGDGLDNRRANLRITTRRLNSQNLAVRRDSRTGIRGVSWEAARGKFRCTVRIDGRSVNVGRYDTLEEAAVAVGDFRLARMTHTNEERYGQATR